MKRTRRHPTFALQLALGAAAMLTMTGCDTDKGIQTPAFQQVCNGKPVTTNKPRREDLAAPYFGCANDANLRAMLENPADLDRGRTLGPANGERESGSVENYRAGKSTAPQGSQPATSSTTILSTGSGSGGTQ